MNLTELKEIILESSKSAYMALPFEKGDLVILLTNYEKAVEVLKFYGDKERWRNIKHCEEESKIRIDAADFDTEIIEPRLVFIGGKIARQTLKELGEI